MAKAAILTANAVKNAKKRDADYWLADAASGRGAGRLVLRVGAGGAKRWYYKYSVGGKYQRVPLGSYAEDGDGKSALTLAQARGKASELAALHTAPDTKDVRAALQAEQAAKEQAELERRQAEEAAAREVEAGKLYTLRKLCELYVERLRKAEKVSARDANSVFTNHVYGSELADKPAASVSAKDITALLRKIAEAGKGRTAGKCRAFLRAAYALALKAELTADAPAALLGFDLTANPVAPTDALSRYARALERVLSVEELAGYWRRVKDWPGLTGDALRLHLLTGGQRSAQLLRVKVEDFDGEGLTLRDSKGNRSKPRLHYVPLVGDALSIVSALAEKRKAVAWPWLFTTHGKKHTRPDTLTAAVAEIVEEERKATKKALLEAGVSEAVAEKRSQAIDYELRDVRRTVETLLAGNGVSREARAHLQSHGLGGVQQRHYDKHDYLAEKTAALALWHQILADVLAGKYQAGKVRRLKVAA